MLCLLRGDKFDIMLCLDNYLNIPQGISFVSAEL